MTPPPAPPPAVAAPRWAFALGLTLLLAANAAASYALDRRRPAREPDLVYVPELHQAWRALALGQYGLAADLTWIRTHFYVSEHFGGDLPSLYRLYDAITTFDPYQEEAYVEGSLLLTGLTVGADEATRLLRRGMRERPDAYWLPWNLAVIEFLENGERDAAVDACRQAAEAARRVGDEARAAGFEEHARDFATADARVAAYRIWMARRDDPRMPEMIRRAAGRKILLLQTAWLVEIATAAARVHLREHGAWPADLDAIIASGLVRGAAEELQRAAEASRAYDREGWPAELLRFLAPDEVAGHLRRPPAGGHIILVESSHRAVSDVLEAIRIREMVYDLLDRYRREHGGPPRRLDDLPDLPPLPSYLRGRWIPPESIEVEPAEP